MSGGEDDVAYIFSPIPSSSHHGESEINSDSYPPTKLTGHTDSVVSTGWSFDGEMVATGGMDGRVRVWRRVKGRRGSQEDGVGSGVAEWNNWEFLTSLETGSEIQVSNAELSRCLIRVDSFGSGSHGIPKAMSYLLVVKIHLSGCGTVRSIVDWNR